MDNGWHPSRKPGSWLWATILLAIASSGFAGCASSRDVQAGKTNLSDGSISKRGNAKDDSPGMFDGDWGYVKQCDSGHFIKLVLKQEERRVFGKWDAGTYIRGSSGLLEGVIRGDRLFVRYCSEDDEKGYPVCPKYEDETDYFVRRGKDLIRYQKYGDAYQADVVLHRDIPGQEIPIDTTRCEEDAGQAGAP